MSKKLEQLEERLSLLESKIKDYKEKNNPRHFKSQLITCKTCNSKINKDYFTSYSCPVCGNSMMSDTVFKTLDRYLKQKLELTNKIAVERSKTSNKKSSSKKSTVKSAYQESIEEVYDRYDDILVDTDCGDFREIIGEIGGDVETIRVYKNGNIYAK